MNNNLLEKALVIATKAHEGQTDKSGVPYILPPRYGCRTDAGQMKKKSLHCCTM